MVFNNVLLRAKDPQRVTEISGLLSQQASLSAEEPGCERFDVYQSETEPELFLLIEVWASEGIWHSTGKRKPSRNCISRRYCHWCTVSLICAAGSGQAQTELDSFAKNGMMVRFSNHVLQELALKRIIQLGISGLASSLTLFAMHSAQAQSSADLVAAALSHPDRPTKRRDDARRMPLEVLSFAGLSAGMDVWRWKQEADGTPR